MASTQRSRRSSSRSRGRAKKAPSTRASKYVREEIHHKRSGKHPVKNRKQAIAIGLSKARRKGVKVPKKGSKSASRSSTSGYSRRKGSSRKKSPGRSRSKRR